MGLQLSFNTILLNSGKLEFRLVIGLLKLSSREALKYHIRQD